MPAGMPKIEMTFLIDANGILQVTARELRTGQAAAIDVRPTYGLSEADVERMVDESFTYAEADVEARLLIEARTEADTVITHVERALRQAGALATPEEQATIARTLGELRQAGAGVDRDLIRNKTTELNQVTARLAEAMMDAALKGALGSRRTNEIMESS
jgi:molecular chaperone DnaK (HSP70)